MSGPLSLAINAVNSLAASVLENSFPDVATIGRPSNAPLSDYGTSSPNPTDVATNVPCSWKQASNSVQEYVRALKLTSVGAYQIEFAIGVDVKPEDRITIAARGDESAHTFEVKGLVRRSGVSVLAICTLEEN